MIVLPLKVPKAIDLTLPLSKWIDLKYNYEDNKKTNDNIDRKNNNLPPFTSIASKDSRDSILRITSLRNCLSSCIGTSNSFKVVLKEDGLKDCMEYHARLLECENRGFPIKDKEGKECDLKVEWECAFNGNHKPSTGYNLRYERASVLFNVMSLQSYLAEQHDLSTKSGVREAAKLYNSAAGICNYIRKEVLHDDDVHSSIDLKPASLEFCEKLLLAQSQDCVYRMALSQSSTLNSVLAKVASAAVELYAEALLPLQLTPELQIKLSELGWDDVIRSTQMLFRARVEYHESAHVKNLICNRPTEAPKDGYGIEIARLTVAQSMIEQALLYGERVAKKGINAGSRSVCAVTAPMLEIQRLKRQINERKHQAESDNNEIYHERVPSARALKPIKPERLSKCTPLNKSLLPESLSNPGFTNLLGPEAYHAVETFGQLLSQEVYQSTILANRQTDYARQSLSAVNLPQSLSAYTASDRGQGFPIELWRKIESLQKAGTFELVKVKLWDLKDNSQTSRDILNSVTNQLNNDLELHNKFTSSHNSYTGKDIKELQSPLRENLNHCKNLLDNATQGDITLLSMQDKLENDIKYQYLTLSKVELDNLIPSSDNSQSYDTSHLTKLMVELTNLIKERESLLKKFNQDASSYDFKSKIIADSNSVDLSPQECKYLIDSALATFEPIKLQIENTIDKQPSLLQKILDENKRFANALQPVSDNSHNDSSQDVIHKIEEALITLETIDKQLAEGQEFYISILPLLRQLKGHSEELSSRLEIERLSFDQDERRRLQEEDDWKVAHDLEESMKNARIEESNESSYSNLNAIPPPSQNNTQDHNDNNSEPPLPSYEEAISSSIQLPSVQNNQNLGSYVPPPLPGAHFVSNFENPTIRVDDEKMARLLELGFDPDKVAHALEKCNNNENDALNELLST